MALLNCPECGKKVSDQAESCPFCAYPIKSNVDAETKTANKPEQRQLLQSKKTAKISPKIAISVAIGAVLIISLFLSQTVFGLSKEEKAAIETVNQSIYAIGEVTDKSDKVITEAEAKLAVLDEKLHRHVDGMELLTESRQKFNQLKADPVIKMISNIGEITSNSLSKIDRAQSAYKKLSDDQKLLVTNFDDIEKNRSAYFEFLVKQVEDKINQIGKVTIDSEKAISNARTSWKGLDEGLRNRVTNYNKLETAEIDFKALIIDTATKKIEELGTIDLTSNEKISEIETFVNRLTPSERSSIPNYKLLENARNTFDSLKQAELKTAREKLLKETIQVTNLSFTRGYFGRSVDLYINYINKSQKTIKYLDFDVKFTNAVGDVVRPDFEHYDVIACRDTGPYGPGEGLMGNNWSWYFSGLETATDVKLMKINIIYTDGTTVTISKPEELAMIQY